MTKDTQKANDHAKIVFSFIYCRGFCASLACPWGVSGSFGRMLGAPVGAKAFEGSANIELGDV